MIDPKAVRPLGKLVLIRGDSAAKGVKKDDGSILIYTPDTAQRNSGCVGTVVAVGPDVSEVKAEDRVTFESLWEGEFATRLRHEGDDYYMVPLDHVTGVLE